MADAAARRREATASQDASHASSGEARSIFDEEWWLLAATDGRLERVEVSWDRVVVGSIFYHPTRRGLMLKAALPPYTRLMTPLINAPGEKASSISTNKTRILRELLARLSHIDLYQTTIRSDPDLVLSYQINDFDLGPKITFLSPRDDPQSAVLQRMDHKLRNAITTASRYCRLERHMNLDRFRRMRSSVSEIDFNDYEAFERIVEAVALRRAGVFLTAVSDDGQDLATDFVVWDAQRLYYLAATRLNTAVASKAATWLFSESIAFAKALGRDFDADGFATVASAKSLQRWGLSIVLNTNVSRSRLAYQLLKPIKNRIRKPPF
jgi:hypothetical protein